MVEVSDPLAMKQSSNILSPVTGGCNTFSQDQQFQISCLVLQLQGLMTVDNSNKANGISLDVPNATTRATQQENHVKPMHEIQANTGQFTVVSVTKASGLHIVPVMNVSILMHTRTA